MNKYILAGIKERLDSLAEADSYFTYGRLIAEDKVEYSPDVLSDAVKLHKIVGRTRENTLDW